MRARGSAESGPIRVFVAGTFDGLHGGHISLFRYARRWGAALARRRGRDGVHVAVVVARDDSVNRIKGRLPHHDQQERRALVAALRLVDEAFVGFPNDFLRSVRRVRPELIVLGYDQSPAWEKQLRAYDSALLIRRCPEYHGHRLKSSKLRIDLERMRT